MEMQVKSIKKSIKKLFVNTKNWNLNARKQEYP